MKFTEEQQQIFHFVREGAGHGIIDAVAGAGKTTTIMACAKYAKRPSRVLFCAFNNGIAREIRRKFIAREMPEVTVKTIHSLGLQMLMENPDFARRMQLSEYKYANLLKSDEMQEALAPFYAQLVELNNYGGGGEKRAFASKKLRYAIDRKLLNINDKHRSCINGPKKENFDELVSHYGIFSATDEASEGFAKELRVYHKMHRILLTAGTKQAAEKFIIDFTDMIYLPFVWKLTSSVRYEWIFIDECQDLSKAQFAVAAKYGKKGSRILAVGDPRQSIYGFTGADAESFDRVKRMTKARQLPLTTCFRCPRKVIELAQTIRPDITGAKSDPGKVIILDEQDVSKHAKPKDLIICRYRHPLLLLAFNFIDRNVKVHIAEDEAKEFLNELGSLFKTDERRASIKRRYRTFKGLREQVFARNMWVIRQEAARISGGETKEKYLTAEETYLNKRLDFLQKKHRQWEKTCRTVESLLKKINTYLTAKKNAVRLSTIHRAKGLEEKRVFILDYDKLPIRRPQQRGWELRQEENLQYVAITRAEDRLYLVHSEDYDEEEEDQ